MSIPTLCTENLYLRPFALQDVNAWHAILSGKDVLRYFPGSPMPSRDQAERMIERMLGHWQEHGYGLWAVELHASGRLIGRAGLQFIPETDEVEVDFILDRAFWGRGFATEAGQASLAFGYDLLKVETIVGIVHPQNLASQRVLQKIGLSFVEETTYFGMAVQRYAGRRSPEASEW